MVVNDPDALAMEFGFTPPSTTLKALSLRAAGEISYPSSMQAFIFESSANAYGGMATNVQLGGNPCDLFSRQQNDKMQQTYTNVQSEEAENATGLL